MNFPFLSVITFTPLVAALIILMLPADRKNEARVAGDGDQRDGDEVFCWII
jgi:NADH:ubiquinone oxidoreductase subunit 4 (subunit M)